MDGNLVRGYPPECARIRFRVDDLQKGSIDGRWLSVATLDRIGLK